VPGVETSGARVDVGMIQRDALEVDLPATLAAHEDFLSGWDAAVQREAQFIRDGGFRLVVGDIPALAFAAAKRAGVPSAAFGNFSWDWILDYYAEREPRFKRVAQAYARAYSHADELLRLPMSGDFPAFRRVVDIPLAVSRSSLKKEEARALWGLAPSDRRRAVLVSFGGFGAGRVAMTANEDLSDLVFAGFGPKPEGFRADWIEFPTRAKVPHVDILAACDAEIGKPGYGTLSESVAHRVPMSYLPREDFPEVPRLLEWLKAFGVAAGMSRADFFAGRWRSALESLWSTGRPWPEIRLDGARVAAERLLSSLPAA
jgi:L-arabinokinase